MLIIFMQHMLHVEVGGVLCIFIYIDHDASLSFSINKHSLGLHPFALEVSYHAASMSQAMLCLWDVE